MYTVRKTNKIRGMLTLVNFGNFSAKLLPFKIIVIIYYCYFFNSVEGGFTHRLLGEYSCQKLSFMLKTVDNTIIHYAHIQIPTIIQILMTLL